jgi:AraC-like DNA-binding protein
MMFPRTRTVKVLKCLFGGLLMSKVGAVTVCPSSVRTGKDWAANEPKQGLVYGLHALIAEMACQGVTPATLLKDSGLSLEQLEDPQARITREQRLAIYRSAVELTKRPDVGLVAGRRQRVSDYGIFGYALASCRTMGDALDVNTQFLRQAGPVLEITCRFEGNIRIYRSHDPGSVGELLPFVAEFWRSSIQTLFSRTLEAPFPSARMLFPYKAPPHWRSYARQFRCPVEFDAPVMEWHMDTEFDSVPLPNSNPVTAAECRRICLQILAEEPGSSDLEKSVKRAMVALPGRFAGMDEVARSLHISRSTLHRRLCAENLSFQTMTDDVRKGLAVQYLQTTPLTIEQICERLGFSDAANFRRAFKRWFGMSPQTFRTSNLLPGSHQ